MITESFDVCQTSSITALLMINYEQYPFTISVLKPYSYNYVSMLLMEPQCPTICSFHLHVEKSSYKFSILHPQIYLFCPNDSCIICEDFIVLSDDLIGLSTAPQSLVRLDSSTTATIGPQVSIFNCNNLLLFYRNILNT